ncbi:universal stress protein [Nocardia rhizosphaerae]|uniref:Universal stress protein n=1 Tax=Nocardia rhizosphaerae TaxID=1691571 RepID=A0ABV8LCP1_9NOCA
MSTPANPKHPVVVGVDESEQSRHALRWAGHYAAAHRVPVRLVYAVEVPVEYGPGLVGALYDLERPREHGAALVAAAAEEIAAIGDLTVSTEVVVGSPAAVLRQHSRSARLVVVGSRGLGALRRTLLGSVSTSIARHAECPVAIIPETAPPADGAVVVGVDGSPCSVDAVGIAFEEAARRGVRLIAVHAWTEFFRYEARSTMQAEGEVVLSESLAGYAEKYPEVRVERVVVEERPAKALLAVSEGAQLVVVGSHGRGGFSGMTLGSVAQTVLHGTDRPLIIARPSTR